MIRVLHITQKWGPGRGGVKTFIETMLANDAPDIKQSVLSVGKVEGKAVGNSFYGPLVDSYNSFAIATAGERRLVTFLLEHHFDIVQIHTNNGVGFLFSHAAKSAGVPTRIVHCHSSSLGSKSAVKRGMNNVLIKRFSSDATALWACGKEAGNYLFHSDNFTTIHNGVDTDKFRYLASNRFNIRQQYEIPNDCILVGFVGAGVPVKNTVRAINVFSEFKRMHSSARFVLLGCGEELDKAKEAVEKLSLGQAVIFTGTVGDIWRYYSAMDVLFAPSFYEGLPIAFVEAQANGLPVLCSSAVSEEADLTGLVQRFDLLKSDEEWARRLGECACERITSSAADFSDLLDKEGYTTNALYQQLAVAYRDMAEG